MYFHNVLRRNKTSSTLYFPEGVLDTENQGEFIPGSNSYKLCTYIRLFIFAPTTLFLEIINKILGLFNDWFHAWWLQDIGVHEK